MAEVVEGPWLRRDDQAWLRVIDTFQHCYQEFRTDGLPEDAALRLTISQLIDSIRNTYRI